MWKVMFLGLITGSFLNVCIYRLPKGKSIVYPPSSCPKCNTALKFKDLIPVLSWVCLRGYCRYCHEKISFKYPLVELLTSLSFILIYLQWGFKTILIPYFSLTCLLIVSSFTDLSHRIIPNEIVLFGLISFIAFNCTIDFISWQSAILGGCIGGGFLLFLAMITKGAGMGLGDVKIMAVIGLYLGSINSIIALMLSFIIGSLFGIILVLMKVLSRSDEIPFGPFLSLGSYITILKGYEILSWYLDLFIM